MSLPPAYSDSGDVFSSRLKRIQDALRRSAEEQFQVDELDLEDANATSYSVLKWTDKFSFAAAKSVVSTGDEMPEEPDFVYNRFHYRLDHRGHKLYDSSHFDNNGFIRGEPKFMLGVDWAGFGGELAWDMDGKNDYGIVPSNSNVEITGLTSFSFAFLIYPRDLSLNNGFNRVVMSHQEDPSNKWAKKIEIGTDGKLYFSIMLNGFNRLFESPAATVVINAWQWGVITFNEYATPKCTMYLNGTAKTVSNSTHNPNFVNTDDNDMAIGVNSGITTLEPYDPFLDEFQFNEDGELSPDGLLLLRLKGKNPNLATDEGSVGVRPPTGGAFDKVLYMIPYGNVGGANITYDTFPVAYDLVTDNTKSSDGKWKLIKKGTHPLQDDKVRKIYYAACKVNPSATNYNAISQILGHEIIETQTSPDPFAKYGKMSYKNYNNSPPDEIADECLSTTFTYPDGLSVQGYWSNSDNKCTVPTGVIPVGKLKYVFDFKFGSQGNGNGQFQDPHDISFDSSGNIFVTDRIRNDVQKFTPDGHYISKFGGTGSGDGQLNVPYSAQHDANDNLYIADRENNRIQKFSPSGTYISKITSANGKGFDKPEDITFDRSNGDIYILDTGNNRCVKFTSAHVFIREWGSFGTSGNGKFDHPHSINTDNLGNVYISCGNLPYIQKFDKNGNFIKKWGSEGNGEGQVRMFLEHMDIDINQRVHLVNNDVRPIVNVWDTDGNWLCQYGNTKSGSADGQFKEPEHVTCDSTGRPHVVDAKNQRIQIFRPTLSGSSDTTSTTKKFTTKGGPILKTPKIFLIFWGSDWQTRSALPTAATIIDKVQNQLLDSDSVYFSKLEQYGGADIPTWGGFCYNTDYPIPSSTGISETIVEKVITNTFTKGFLPIPDDTSADIYILIVPVGKNLTTNTSIVGYHNVYKPTLGTAASADILNPVYNVPQPGNSSVTLVSPGIQRCGIQIANTNSDLYRVPIKTWVNRLKKTGTPSGNITAKIRNSADTVVATFTEVVNSTSLTTSFADKTWTLATPYALQSGDRILVEYSGASGVIVETFSTDQWDGANTIQTTWDGTSYTNTTTADVVGQTTVLSDSGKVGVRVPLSPNGGFTRVFYEYPYLVLNEHATASDYSKVLTDPNYYGDFDVTFSARTVRSLRTPTPNVNECFRFLFHYNETDGGEFHHYYLMLKTDGHLELGRRDNTTQDEVSYKLLAVEPTFTFAYNTWNKVRVKVTGNHIEVWIDDVSKIDLVDDGTTGEAATDTTLGNPPHPPSTAMFSGKFGMQSKDAESEMSPMTIVGGGTILNNTNTTSESLVTTIAPYFRDFDASFSMRTIKKLKGTFVHDYEAATFWFRFNEADHIFYHRYYVILKDTKVEFGRVDNEDDSPAKKLLFDGGTFNLILGQWYDIRIRAIGNHFTLWINGSQIFDLIDDGKLKDTSNLTIPEPSSKMHKGLFGFSAKDCEAEFSPLLISNLPTDVIRNGYWKGGYQDLRMYRRVLTSTEAVNLNTNNISVTNIAAGKVATIGASVFNE